MVVSLTGKLRVELDHTKIDQAMLGLMYLTLHDGQRVWKTYDWDATNRLHKAGLIMDPAGKAKSIVPTEAGLKEAERLCKTLFGK